MNSHYKNPRYFLYLLAILTIGLLSARNTYADVGCSGKFPNPITDICWSCLYPLTIGSAPIMSLGQEDIPNPSNPVCACLHDGQAKIGGEVGFWEPIRAIEVTKTPFCMVNLGGVKLNPGLSIGNGAQGIDDAGDKNSSWQAHYYIEPLLAILQIEFQNDCIDTDGFDVGYMTEPDPLWMDDELTFIIDPDVTLTANIFTQAFCASDCAAATAGFPIPQAYFCAGCQGSMFPLTGNVSAHLGGVQASALIVQRMVHKMHREGLIWAADGETGLCGKYPQLIMDKSKYKMQMTFPIPATDKVNGHCCQPFGRTTTIWESGKEFPYKGEDFSYMISRKRNCCQGAVGF